MTSLKLLTWLDVQRIIREKTYNGREMPEGITNLECFSDALEVGIVDESAKSKAQRKLKEWFSDWYQTQDTSIRLDFGDVDLPVEFLIDDEHLETSKNIRPFWEEIAYAKSVLDDINQANLYALPERFYSPKVIAFYSFKGGVGRTLHLASHVFGILESAKAKNKSITVLVIDADLEAPGLTYWDKENPQKSFVSFLNFLEIYHYSPIPREQTLDLFAREIKRTPRKEGKSTLYFLPAFLHEEQLLDTPVLPEHLARSGEWTCSQAIYNLGQAVSADYVFIDLRAGLSEISSPLVFDSRIQRFFVTTAAEQSVAGLSLVLKQISRIAPNNDQIDSGGFYDPTIIISFLTPELKQLSDFEEAIIQFRDSYAQAKQSEEDSIYSKRLEIQETDFSQELLYINSWNEARSKLAPTSIMKVAREWANSHIQSQQEEQNLSSNIDNKRQLTAHNVEIERELKRFRNICQQYEFAESGKGESLLVTQPLKNLATHFQNELPKVVSLGSKGSGKTFTYVQLSRLQYWEKFIEVSLKLNAEIQSNNHHTYIFPLLQSSSLQESAENWTSRARKLFRENMMKYSSDIPEFSASEFSDKIKEFLRDDRDEPTWTKFWIGEISRYLGFGEEELTLNKINDFLKEKQVRVVVLFDGLEDLFQEAASEKNQQIAIKALIDLPKRLSELRKSNLGLLIMLRRDYLGYAITQNAGQFESLYRAYDLFWNLESFLKLVYWICSQADLIGASEEELEGLSREEIDRKLDQLWGKKLGKETSNEAHTSNWIFAALTDFKGRLQARDIVRLLYHAADIALENSQDVQLKRWSSDRLLPPQAIRRALEPCSKKKVEEAEQEYPEFQHWRNQLQENYSPAQKVVPFTLESLSLEPKNLKLLEEMGVIYEYKDKNGTISYYMPEIFRKGLGFELKGGARPRVLALKRKALNAQR